MTDDKQPSIFLADGMKTVPVVCANCQQRGSIDLSSYPDFDHLTELTFDCAACHQQQTLQVERRRYYRKSVWLPGKYHKKEEAENGGEMIVKNISWGGLLLQTGRELAVARDDELRVDFKLDDAQHSFVQKDVLVRYQNKVMVEGLLASLVGVEFSSCEHPERLKAYFDRHMT